LRGNAPNTGRAKMCVDASPDARSLL